MENSYAAVVAAALVGLAVVVLFVLLGKLRRAKEAQHGPPKGRSPYSKDDKQAAPQERKKENVQGGKSKKKIVEGRWANRSDKQTYSHPWLLTSLKGHTGSILDMDFSGNGKYLVSCGEEDPDPGGVATAVTVAETEAENVIGGSSSESSAKEDSPRPSSVEPSPCPKGLTRRQKKNRRREEVAEPTKKAAIVPLRQYLKFNNTERVFLGLLHNYLLTHDQMVNMGYPVKHFEQNLVAIYKSPRVSVPTFFDVNARAFVPKNEQNDSGQGSGSSSDSGENFDAETSSNSSTSSSDRTFYEEEPRRPRYCGDEPHYSRTCCRCGRLFYTTSEEYLTRERCTYHWGKLQTVNSLGDKKHGQLAYSCCRGRSGSRGCSEGQVHVWSGLQYGMNGVYDDYVFTKPRRTPPPDGNYGVYALDCEMCYTVRGLELTKVTVVGADGRLVYDSYVRPDLEIVDYNTRFSGVSARDLKRASTKNLREVQNDLMGFVNASTILIGHGLENDLRALKIVHYYVVDTAYSFPHYNGLPYRRSLKNLTSSLLKRDIQCGRNGHNSYDDASACMELMLWRVRKDFRSYLSNL